jgi:hypothetical protein
MSRALSANNFACRTRFLRTKLGSCFWTTPKHWGYRFFCLLIVGILIGCGSATPGPDVRVSPEPDAQLSPLAHVSPLATATAMPTKMPTETPTLQPTFTPTPAVIAEPMQLVVFHTNDNWGETEPCG